MAADLMAVGFGNYPKSGTAIVSGAYNAADPTAAEFGTLGAVGLTVVIDVTAVSGAGATVTVNVEGFDPASGKWVTLLTSAGLIAVATTPIIVDPRVAPTANVAAQKPLFERMRIRPVKSGTTTTLSYSIGIILAQ